MFVIFRISEMEPNNLVYDPLVSSEIRNISISTQIVGNIRKGPGSVKESEADVLYALCTLDGILQLCHIFTDLLQDSCEIRKQM